MINIISNTILKNVNIFINLFSSFLKIFKILKISKCLLKYNSCAELKTFKFLLFFSTMLIFNLFLSPNLKTVSALKVRGLTRAAALELGLHGIRVNSVHPGGVNTPMTNPFGQAQEDLDKGFQFVPMQRGSQPVEIAHGVTYLASDAAGYCNGTELVIDGGMTSS